MPGAPPAVLLELYALTIVVTVLLSDVVAPLALRALERHVNASITGHGHPFEVKTDRAIQYIRCASAPFGRGKARLLRGARARPAGPHERSETPEPGRPPAHTRVGRERRYGIVVELRPPRGLGPQGNEAVLGSDPCRRGWSSGPSRGTWRIASGVIGEASLHLCPQVAERLHRRSESDVVAQPAVAVDLLHLCAAARARTLSHLVQPPPWEYSATWRTGLAK